MKFFVDNFRVVWYNISEETIKESEDMTIGEKIKYLRKPKGVTQTELAQITGIHQVSIAKYEKDKMVRSPTSFGK